MVQMTKDWIHKNVKLTYVLKDLMKSVKDARFNRNKNLINIAIHVIEALCGETTVVKPIPVKRVLKVLYVSLANLKLHEKLITIVLLVTTDTRLMELAAEHILAKQVLLALPVRVVKL
jgi:ABC-type uncharacterized transport system permease subunit